MTILDGLRPLLHLSFFKKWVRAWLFKGHFPEFDLLSRPGIACHQRQENESNTSKKKESNYRC